MSGSLEMIISAKMAALNCGVSDFCAISGTGRTRFSQALNGSHILNYSEARRLVDLLEEMEALQKDCATPIDWSRAEQINTLLQIRRQALPELGRLLEKAGADLSEVEHGTRAEDLSKTSCDLH